MASPGSNTSPGLPGAKLHPTSLVKKRLRAPGPVAFTGIVVALGTCTHHRTQVQCKLKSTKRHTPFSRHTIHILLSVTCIAVSGPECFGVPPSDPRFNPDIVDETLAEVLAHEEGQPVSVHQVSSQVQDDLLLVTIIDAAGPCAVSSKSLSQTLMIQALNPKSYLRRRFTNAPLRELQAPLSSPSVNHSPQVNSCFETTVA